MGHSILLVDDEKPVLNALKKAFSRYHMEADVAESLDEARELLERNAYRVVVTDLGLTKMEGREGLALVRQVRNRRPDAHVILITGHGTQEVVTEAYRMGATCYFEKPVSAHLLMEAVALLMGNQE